MRRAAPSDLEAQAIGLFLDVDGTIIDIAPTPDAVEVPPLLLDDLRAVRCRLGGALALLSGRPIAELDRLFSPLRLAAAGIHGAELRYTPEGPIEVAAAKRLPAAAWQALQLLLERFPGVSAENKGMTFAVHYRGADADGLLPALCRFIADYPELNLDLVGGRRVYEIKLPGFDKGTALRHFMARPPFVGRKPVFVADDEVDRPGFAAALELGGAALSVGFEAPDLSGSFPQPSAVRDWLGSLRRAPANCPVAR